MLVHALRYAPRSQGIFCLGRFRFSTLTLPNDTSIKVFDHPSKLSTYILTYLDTQLPSHDLAIGYSSKIPPTPQTFSENKRFVDILNSVLVEYGDQDDGLRSQAQAFASTGRFNLGEGPIDSTASIHAKQQRPRKTPSKETGRKTSSGVEAEGASGQGGAGGGGRGFVHLSDSRCPPEFGRIAWPEDILGSAEVDGTGQIVGQLVPSGTYRVLTNNGILGLSPFLRDKLIERLRREEAKEAASKIQ